MNRRLLSGSTLYLSLLLVCMFCPDVKSDGATKQPDCKQPADMSEMTTCSLQEFSAADKKLNDVYQQLQSKIETAYSTKELQAYKPGYITALKASKNAWLHFRDLECAFSTYENTGGSSREMYIYACKTTLTSERIKQLQDDLQSFDSSSD